MKQGIFAGVALLLVVGLFFLGKTVPKHLPQPKTPEKPVVAAMDILSELNNAKKQLSPNQLQSLANLDKQEVNAKSDAEKSQYYLNAAQFWKDSARSFYPYAYYISQAAKLDNSEKSLTFAGQIISDAIRSEHDESKMAWLKSEAVQIFEQGLKINPENDDMRIGLGATYIYGSSHNAGGSETMQGIQELLKVVRKDSTNMKAQLVLGVGGVISGQYDKAIERLLKVVHAQPNNLEAVAFLADAYAAHGNKEEAIRWYTASKSIADNPEYSKEVDNRIKSLK